jgi:hypothetical protein
VAASTASGNGRIGCGQTPWAPGIPSLLERGADACGVGVEQHPSRRRRPYHHLRLSSSRRAENQRPVDSENRRDRPSSRRSPGARPSSRHPMTASVELEQQAFKLLDA